jgi:hypothetical protein
MIIALHLLYVICGEVARMLASLAMSKAVKSGVMVV